VTHIVVDGLGISSAYEELVRAQAGLRQSAALTSASVGLGDRCGSANLSGAITDFVARWSCGIEVFTEELNRLIGDLAGAASLYGTTESSLAGFPGASWLAKLPGFW
jgi:hypothetical protein